MSNLPGIDNKLVRPAFPKMIREDGRYPFKGKGFFAYVKWLFILPI